MQPLGLVRANLVECGWAVAQRPPMTKRSPFKYFKTSPEIISQAVMLYVRFRLSLPNVEYLLRERGMGVSHEAVRFWRHRFGPLFAFEIRKRRIAGMKSSKWRWHLDEMFVKIKGEQHYLRRVVDHEGEVPESIVTKCRDRKAALKFLRKAMKRHGQPEIIVTNKLCSYGVALKVRGNTRSSADRPLVKQSVREFAPALSTTRKGDSPVQANAKFAEVSHRSRLCLQPFQLGAQSLLPTKFQAEPHCRSR